MKAKSNFVDHPTRRGQLVASLLAVSLLVMNILCGPSARAATIQWNVGAGQWTNTLDWTGGFVPGIADTASFNTSLITGNPNITVNVAPASTLQVGALTVGNSVASNFRLTAQSTAVNPTTLNLNGVGGILLSNASSSFQVIITNASTAPGTLLELGLANSGVIYANNTANINPPMTRPADNSGGEIAIYSIITGSGSITNAGPGILYFNAANTYTGSTTLAAGTLELSGTGTIGNGAGALFFSGGNLETGGNSTTRIIYNPMVVNTPGNAYIYNSSGTAGTRVLVFSNNITGTSGTLVLGNANLTVGEFMDVQLLGSFTFNLPVVVGDNLGDAYSDNYPSTYSELQLANSAASGSQTFNGAISGDGPIYRGNVSAGVSVTGDNGATIFTGDNTYSGGTIINSGTLFANNSSGSALGSGSVIVTNNGTLAGNGSVMAQTTIGGISGGTVQPGATSTTVGNLSVGGGLTFEPGSAYTWQIASATGSAGTAWDLITCAGGWTDAGGSPVITINVTSQGAPVGWNDATSYSWMVISNNGSATGFNTAHWTVNTAGFGGPLAGIFGVTNDVNGDLLLTYTPASGNIVINVSSGSVTQGGVSPTPYPILSGLNTVTKVGNGEVILTNSANNYQGATYIDAGTVSAAVDSTTAGGAFGASTSPLAVGNTGGASSNATLNIDQPGVSVANAIVVQSGNAGIKTIATSATGGQVIYGGNVTLNDNVTLSVVAGGSELFLGNFSGVGGIMFAGGGTNTMDGTGSYDGPTTLAGGELNLDASAIGTNTFTISGVSVLDNTIGGAVTLANNPPQNWNADFAFTGTGGLNLGTGPVTLGANRTLSIANNVLTVGGPIAGSGYGLTLMGPGELLLASATGSTYSGGTTNMGGILAVNATGTFGNGAGPVVFSGGGNLLATGTRSGLPIANPVTLNSTTRVYGNSTDTAAPNRILPFTGPFTINGGSTLIVDDVGSSGTIFNMRLLATNGSPAYTNINWPVMIGDPSFDTPGTTCQLDLQNDSTTPQQIVSGLISGVGQLVRSAPTVNTGGTTILTQQNTFSGGTILSGGSIGLGASSVTNGGGVVSGPLGAGLFQLGAQTAETNLTVFASSGPVEIDNPVFLNGDTFYTFGGNYNMLFTAGVNSGGVAKTLSVTSGITVTFSGPITNTGSSTGGALTKTGAGALVFSGVSTYPGTTTVNTGKLLVDGAIGTNIVTVNSPGALGGTGALGGNLTFADSGGQAYLYKTAGSPDSPLAVAGNLTLDGNAVTVDLGGTTTLGPGTYTILTYAGTLSGALAAVPIIVNGSLAAGNIATIDMTTTNEVNLVVGPGSYSPPNFPPGGVGYLPSGNISLTVTGAVGTAYRLWATTNIALKPVTSTWTLLNSGTISASPFTNYDLTATNYPQRFYQFTTP